MKLDEIVKAGLWRLGVVRVRTVVNPLLWLVGLTLPCSVLAGVFVDDQLLKLVFLGFAGISIVSTLVAYFIFMFRAPDRLQSEEYQLRQRELRMIYRHGRRPDMFDEANQDVRVETPNPQIGAGEKE
jgi:hypothetical protein